MALKEIAYVAGAVGRLPGWIKFILYVLVSGLVTAVAGYWGKRMMIAAAILMLVIGIVLFAYILLARWVRERKAAELRGELDSGPAEDSAVASRREQLREEFSRGLETFQMAGKDMYELPWFVVLGEPQSGKTEAIRRSGLEFPLTSSPQGDSMRSMLGWWFTNYAVLLDTAGDLCFGDTRQGVRPEWAEFLTLLKKHRRACPINGFVLTISADSLEKDSPREIEQKAGVIARHLDAAQSILGVAVPVFVLITKCDRLEGFTSFFASSADPTQSRQMLGWSNPAALEAPFRPEIFEEYLRILTQRLKRRRLALLADPTPRQPGTRRIDEVDALFDLPRSIQNTAPRLRRYLENIFVAGEWTTRPLFLRGVYFTAAAGIAPAALPGGVLGEGSSDASRFLRDIYLDKIFREDSLVVDSDDDRPAKIRRRLVLFAIGTLIICGLFFIAADHYRRLLVSQKAQIHYWERASQGWKGKDWMPLVTKNREGKYIYHGDDIVGVNNKYSAKRSQKDAKLTLIEFQQALANLSSNPLPVPWIYQPMSWVGVSPDYTRYEAQRTILEGSVVYPLLSLAREKMIAGEIGGQWIDPVSFDDAALTREAKALTELVRVEVAIAGRTEGRNIPEPGSTFIPALQEYLTGVPADRRLVAVMNWTYSKNPEGDGEWAPGWTSGGNSLETNAPIRAGVDRLVEFAQNSVRDLGKNLAQLQGLADAATKYVAAENDFAKVANIKGDWNASDQAMANAFENLEAAKIQMEGKLLEVRAAGLFEDGAETLTSALDHLSTGGETRLGQVNVILSEIQSILPPPVKETEGQVSALVPEKDPKFKLLRQIQARLEKVANLINKNTQNADITKLAESFQDLDSKIFATYDKTPSYLWRWAHYQKCAAAAPEYHFRADMYLVGQRWRQLSGLFSAVDALQAEADGYSGGQAQAFITACNYFLQRARALETTNFVDGYITQARAALLRVLRFPLVWPPGPDSEALDINQLQGARSLLQAINTDMQSDAFSAMPAQARQPVVDFTRRIAPLYNVVNSLIKPDGSMVKVSVVLYNGPAQKQLSGPNFTPMPVASPTPTPQPRSLMSKLFTGNPKPSPTPLPGPTLDIANWNAVAIVGGGTGAVYPLDSSAEVLLGLFSVQDSFSFRVYHSLIGSDGTDLVDGGKNWSALRLIARFGGKPVGVGQDWQVPLKPNEPNSVWVKFAFELPLLTTPWPTLDSLGMRQPYNDAVTSQTSPMQ